MWSWQLERYTEWILHGATPDQWNEISTATRNLHYQVFVLYEKGKAVDVRWVDLYKPTTKLRKPVPINS